MKTLTDLEKALRTHDWWYQYSDDPGVFARGRSERDDIDWMRRALADRGQKQEADDLFKKIQSEKLG